MVDRFVDTLDYSKQLTSYHVPKFSHVYIQLLILNTCEFITIMDNITNNLYNDAICIKILQMLVIFVGLFLKLYRNCTALMEFKKTVLELK